MVSWSQTVKEHGARGCFSISKRTDTGSACLTSTSLFTHKVSFPSTLQMGSDAQRSQGVCPKLQIEEVNEKGPKSFDFVF